MKCPTELPSELYFIGCNGKPISDAELSEMLKESIRIEDYHLAAKCKKEIERRKSEYESENKRKGI